ncbi:hypothetical protein OGAPHI_006309 [Ogataea philodendri]|uniref:Uncharacterized protein n=1 Tax=Ogataea philodendri TaxID=1378263 RepID=A0A9P8NY97_9ASCO|nr:uncharacterized protein OGAPHI_006309 [Ogataea philodendri]KAH3662128.1 hypothetical protein OGAPHI_006309 [Ogataea philodendri]
MAFSKYLTPPCAIFVDLDEVPDAKSFFSSNNTFRPRRVASRAAPVPVAPPPTMIKSNLDWASLVDNSSANFVTGSPSFFKKSSLAGGFSTLVTIGGNLDLKSTNVSLWMVCKYAPPKPNASAEQAPI